jgi:hypothetical protein
MATSKIYFNQSGGARLEFDLGTSPKLKYAKVTLKIENTTIHATGSLPKGQEYYDWSVSDSEMALIVSFLSETSNSIKGTMNVDVNWEAWDWDAPIASKTYNVTFILEENEDSKPSAYCVSKEASTLGEFVQGKNSLIYTVSAEAKNNADLKSIVVSINETECDFVTKENGHHIFASDWLVVSGINKIVVTVTDSRGFSRVLHDEIYVYPYMPPLLFSLTSEQGIVCICSRWRPDTNELSDSYGTECRVAVGVSASYIPNVQTGFTVTYRYRERGATVWSEYLPVGEHNKVAITETGSSEYTAIIKDGTYIDEATGVLVGKFNSKTEYEIELKVEDDLGGSTIRYEQLRGQETSFHISPNGKRVSVGKYGIRDNCFDSRWDIHSDENLESDKNVYVGDTLYLKNEAVTVSAEELNYNSGLKENVQKQLDDKANSKHTHKLSDIDATYFGHSSLRSWLSEIEDDIEAIKSQIDELDSKISEL